MIFAPNGEAVLRISRTFDKYHIGDINRDKQIKDAFGSAKEALEAARVWLKSKGIKR